MKLVLIVFLCAFSWPLTSAVAQQANPTLAVFYTRPASDPYYSLVNSFSQTVASSLGIKIKAYYVDSNHLEMIEQVEQVSSSIDKPDAIAFINYKRNDKKILKITSFYNIPTFVFNSKLTETDTHYNSLVSVVSPDDQKAGFDLANYLFDNARQYNKKLFVVGIEGDPVSSASILRKKGLIQAAKKNKDVVLQQVVAGDWSTEIAKLQTPVLLARYPQTNVIWTASDSMAIAVSDIIENNKKHIVTGGIDWSKEGIQAIKKNKFIATYGNQFMELGWVGVLFYDLLFSDPKIEIPKKVNLPMQLYDKINSGEMSLYTDKKCWKKTDFRKYSKALNPEIANYSFVLNIEKCLTR